MIVEGIGGIMVPLTENESIADFVKLANLPLIIVSIPTLGTLNHTLLTIMACKKFRIKTAGIILNKTSKTLTRSSKKQHQFLKDSLTSK